MSKPSRTAPTITKGDGLHEDFIETHPSYAILSFSRISGGMRDPLFGSSILHNEMVALRISHCERIRSLHRDWFHGRKEIIEVYMSSAQFAEAITHLNHGEGTPVTLRHLKGEHVPLPIYEDKKQMFRNEFEERVSKVTEHLGETVERLQKILDTPSPKKSELKNVLGALKMVRQNIDANMPFVVDQFQEQMEKTVTEAKGEVDAFASRVFRDAGLKALAGDAKALLEQQIQEGDA